MNELGQIGELVNILKPQKIRVSARFIPDFTIDLTTPSRGAGILDIIKPKITMLVAGNAYEIEWGKTSIKKADPSIFTKPTFFDTINKTGILSSIIIGGLLGVIVAKVLK